MSNPSRLDHNDVLRLQQLIDLAVENGWYGVAEHLVKARNALRKRLLDEETDRLLDELLEKLKDDEAT